MEPFELTLSQVNFEEKDLSPSQTLHSFSNLVYYDSDFKEDEDSNATPIAPRHFVNSFGAEDPSVAKREKQKLLAEKKNLYTNTFHTISVIEGNPRRLPMDKSLAIEPSTDSFKAFTETVEALALQKSVIGGSNIKPASAEEIAKAIAEAQAKIASGKSGLGSQFSATEHLDVNQTKDGSSNNEEQTQDGSSRDDPTYSFPYKDSPVPEAYASDYSEVASTSEGIIPHEIARYYQNKEDQEYATSLVQSAVTKQQAMLVSQTETKRMTSRDGVQETLEYKSPPEVVMQYGQQEVKVHRSMRNGSPRDSTSKKVSLIRIRPQEVVTITERNPATRVVPSEKIRPANFPTDALSLIMPSEADDENPGNEAGIGRNDSSDHIILTDGVTGGAYSEMLQQHETSRGYGDKDMSYNGQSVEHIATEITHKTAFSGIETSHQMQTETTRQPVQGHLSGDDRTGASVQDSYLKHTGNEHTATSESTHIQTVKRHTATVESSVKNVVRMTKVVTRTEEPLKNEDVFKFMATEAAAENEVEIEADDYTPIVRTARSNQVYSLDKPDLTLPAMKEAEFKLPDIDPNAYKIPSYTSSNTQRQIPLDSVSNTTVDSLREELTFVLKEKAKLEGQLEMLGLEARIAIKERAELQAQVASIKSQLQAHERSTGTAVSERDSLETELHKLRQSHAHLEKVVIDAQRVIENKDAENKSLQEELQVASETKEELNDKLLMLKKEMSSQESSVVDFKNKITELYVEYQMSNQARILAENEMKSLQSEVKSLQNSQKWYQDQLKQLQDSKAEMQQQVTGFQQRNITNMTMIERLKAENVRIKQQLTEAQQKALNEKNILAHHLEVIEADMIEREAAFAQLQQQRLSLEKLVNNEEVKAKQFEEMANIMELQEEISMLKNENRRRQAQVAVLDHEQAELVKRLALSQESILERDKTIDAIEKKVVELQVQCQTFESDGTNKSAEITRLTDLNSTLEDDLKAAKEEKVMFDQALSALKEDMRKVEQNFKKMKNDLTAKESELGNVVSEKKNLEQSVESLQSELSMLRARQEQQIAHLQIEVERQQQENEKLQQSALPISDELSSRCRELEEEKQALEDRLAASASDISTLQQQWEVMQTQVIQKDSQHSAVLDKCRLYEEQLQQAQQEKAEVQCQLRELQARSEELTKLTLSYQEQNAVLAEYEDTHAKYQQHMGDMQRGMVQQQELVKMLQEQIQVYAAKIHHLEAQQRDQELQVASLPGVHAKNMPAIDAKTYEAQIAALQLELANVKSQGQGSDADNYIIEINTLKGQLVELDSLRSQVQTLQDAKADLEKKTTKEQSPETMTISELTQQIHSLQAQLQETESLKEQMALLEAENEELKSISNYEPSTEEAQEVAALKSQIKSLEEQLEDEETLRGKLRSREHELFALKSINDELKESQGKVQDLQMEIYEWKRVVEVMQQASPGDEDAIVQARVKTEVDTAVQQYKTFHELEMKELQQKLDQSQQTIQELQDSTDRLSDSGDDEDMDEEDDIPYRQKIRKQETFELTLAKAETQRIPQEQLNKFVHSQVSTEEQLIHLVLSIIQTQKQPQSFSQGFTIGLLKSLDLPQEQRQNIVETLHVPLTQPDKLSEEDVSSILQSRTLSQEQLTFLIQQKLSKEELQKIANSADETTTESSSKDLEQLLEKLRDYKLSEDQVAALVNAQNLSQKQLISLVHVILPVQQLLPSLDISKEQLKTLVHSKMQPEELLESFDLPEDVKVKLLQPSVSQEASVKSADVPQDQLIHLLQSKMSIEELLMSLNITVEQMIGMLNSQKLQTGHLISLMNSQEYSQHQLSEIIDTIGKQIQPSETLTVSEGLMNFITSVTLTKQQLHVLIQTQKLTKEELLMLTDSTAHVESHGSSAAMTLEELLQNLQAFSMSEEQIIHLLQSQKCSTEQLLSLVKAQNVTSQELSTLFQQQLEQSSPEMQLDLVMRCVQAVKLSPEQLLYVVNCQQLTEEQTLLLVRHLVQSQPQAPLQLLQEQLAQSPQSQLDLLFSLVQSSKLTPEQLVWVIQMQQLSEEQVMILLRHVVHSHPQAPLQMLQEQLLHSPAQSQLELILSLTQSVKLTPEQMVWVTKTQNFTDEQSRLFLKHLTQGYSQEQVLDLVKSMNLLPEQLNVFVEERLGQSSPEEQAKLTVGSMCSVKLTPEQVVHIITSQQFTDEQSQKLVKLLTQVPSESYSGEQILNQVKSHKLSPDEINILVSEQLVQLSTELQSDLIMGIVPSIKLTPDQLVSIVNSQQLTQEQILVLMRSLLSQPFSQEQLLTILQTQQLSQEQLLMLVKSLGLPFEHVEKQHLATESMQLLSHEKEQLTTEKQSEKQQLITLEQEQKQQLASQEQQVLSQEQLVSNLQRLTQEELVHILRQCKLSQDEVVEVTESHEIGHEWKVQSENITQETLQKLIQSEEQPSQEQLQLLLQPTLESQDLQAARFATETTNHLTFALNTLKQLECELKTLETVDRSQPLSQHWNQITQWITLVIKCVTEIKTVHKYYIRERQSLEKEVSDDALTVSTEAEKLANMLQQYRDENKRLKASLQGFSGAQGIPSKVGTEIKTETAQILQKYNSMTEPELREEVYQLVKRLVTLDQEFSKLLDFQKNISRAVGVEVLVDYDSEHATALAQLTAHLDQLKQQSNLMQAQGNSLVEKLKHAVESGNLEERSTLEGEIQEINQMKQLTEAAMIKLEASIRNLHDTCNTSYATNTSSTVEISQTDSSLHPAENQTATYTTPSGETDYEKQIKNLSEELKETKLQLQQLEMQMMRIRTYVTDVIMGRESCIAPPAFSSPVATTDQIDSDAVVDEADIKTLGSFKYYDPVNKNFDKGITQLIQSLEIHTDIKQLLQKELSVIIYENHQIKKAVYDEKVMEILQKLSASDTEIRKLKQILQAKETSMEKAKQDIQVLQEDLTNVSEQRTQLELMLQEANKTIREMSENLTSVQHTHNGHVEKTTEVLNQWQEACKMRDQQLEVFHKQILELQQQLQVNQNQQELQKAEVTENKQLALELEKERGRFAGLMQSYTSLKDHATSLESALAQHESSVTDLSSTSREELEKRNKIISQLHDKIAQLEETIQSEKHAGKDMKKQAMTEKGAVIKVKRQLESLQQENSQLKTDLEISQTELDKQSKILEETREKEQELTVALEEAKQKIAALQTELERLRRDLEEKQGKDPFMQERIKSLEWELSQQTAELEATHNRLQLIEDRKQMELVNIQKALQTSNVDMKKLREELAAVKQDRVTLQAKLAELKAQLEVTNVQNRVWQFQKKEQATMEMTGRGQQPGAAGEQLSGEPPGEMTGIKIESKPLSFLQETLSSLRGEISNLQLQVDEHTCAVQTSSQAWKDLEAQVKDLRELCKTSASDRTVKTTEKKREPPPMVHLPMLSQPDL